MMNDSDLSFFSRDYTTARARFLEAGSAVDAQLHTFPFEDSGTDGAPLSIDVAVVPGANPDHAVVVSSGLHGVEGFFGSAVQLAWLRACAERQTPSFDGTLVMMHALNPYGFEMLRRFDRENIDLNRNFLLPGESYSGAPEGYRKLSPLLNPTGPPTRFDGFPLQALATILRHGLQKMKATTAVGQYEFPRGLFFGGRQAAATTTVVQEHFTEWIGPAQRIVHIDLHTGLGRYGRDKLLLVEPPDSPQLTWYATHFGENAIEPLAPSGGTAYAARGTMGAWLRGQLGDRDYRFLVAEFGTYGPLRVIAALRAENQAFHACPPADPRRLRAGRELLECFCPASPRWRTRVLSRGLEIIAVAHQAVGP